MNLSRFYYRIIKFVNSRFDSTMPNWSEYNKPSLHSMNGKMESRYQKTTYSIHSQA